MFLIKGFLVAVLVVAGGIVAAGKYFLFSGPRDLGIKYSEVDRGSARAKSQVEYGVLPEGTAAENSFQTTGQREVKLEFSAAEATALLNNRPWKYWPYQNIQVKFNGDGSGEISGKLIKSKVPEYAASIGIPKEAVEVAVKFLPTDPVFYLKMRAELSENKVTVFEPQTFEIGRIPLPVNWFLSSGKAKPVYALETSELLGQLKKIENKRSLIIGYINQRLGMHPGFFAKKAKIEENKFIFEGSLPEKELTVR